ncbi:hypothetical protein [Pseudonocardia sp. HH130630-07]|uniref:hypothetical protein n=1 Tax=Pseudonocardia sp. HH130630-07 TaxID=1690815 RepID=UPI000814D716|nr:hypothetical protein [Pseudonocardia sp. HH130630-07]ANY05276.1 hypothetical protein AFB00_01945 [Pseudonocardia sp. HH130630-07]
MRMRFGVDEDEAFHECAGRLIRGFADWLEENELVAEPMSAELLLQYKWLEGDGDLADWPIEHVETFLDGWCPHVVAEYGLPVRLVPLTVAVFVEYLDERGLLTADSPRPSQVRRLCTAYVDDYAELEAHPAHPVLDEFGTPPDPVRIPGPADRAASAAAATVLADARALAAWCGERGRTLTRTGNLRVADARELAQRLGTDDVEDRPRLDRADRLTVLTWVLETAVRAGAVRRENGRLVAGNRFAGLDDTTAHEDLVLAAAEHGVLTVLGERRSPPSFDDVLGELDVFAAPTEDAADPPAAGPPDPAEEIALELLDQAFGGSDGDPEEPDDPGAALPEPVDDATPAFLALLRHPHDGMDLDDLAELLELLLGWEDPRPGIPLTAMLVERLQRLGLVAWTGTAPAAGRAGSERAASRVVLTPGGIACALLVLAAEGLEFPTRPDPAAASAAEIVGLAGEVSPAEWRRDIDAWHTAQPDPERAVAAFVRAALAPGRPLVVVLTATGVAAERFGDDVVDELLREHLDGPHRAQVARRLVARGLLGADVLEPDLLLRAALDVMTVTIDTIDADEWPALFAREFPAGSAAAVGELWRFDHPRLGDVLDGLGTHHPDDEVADAARTALLRWRERPGPGD